MTQADNVCEYGCTGTLEIEDFLLNTPAWDIPSLVRLWAEADVRGENKLLPGAPGLRSYPTRLTQSEHDLAFFIFGDTALDGSAIADAWEGLQDHLDALWTNVFAPVTTGTGTRSATLTMPDGSERLAEVQFEPLTFAGDVYDARQVEAVIHMIIPSGRFA